MSVYDLRRMWRLPGSKHQDTGLYKTLFTFSEFSYGIDFIMNSSKEKKNIDFHYWDTNDGAGLKTDADCFKLADALEAVLQACDDLKDDDDIINKYKDGKIPFLVNVRILVEGFDAPITNANLANAVDDLVAGAGTAEEITAVVNSLLDQELTSSVFFGHLRSIFTLL